MNDDAMSLAMFWAGVLMVFAPLVSAGLVIGIWWFTRRRPDRAAGPQAPPPP
jgi:hypothetical protein